MDAVLLERDNAVAVLTMNRPEVLNALDRALGEALVRAVEQSAADHGIRAIVLTGAGAGFCAGGDIKAAWRYVQEGGAPQAYFGEVILLLNRLVLALRRAEKPVIAAINGVASGAGLSIGAACDLRIAAAGARFKQAYTSIGLVPDGGWTITIPALVGTAKANELLLFDPLLDAGEALRIGLVNEVAAGTLLERAREVAEIAARNPSFAGAKALLNATHLRELEAALERERQAVMARAESADFAARVRQFLAAGARGA